jgi:hypothetical protein
MAASSAELIGVADVGKDEWKAGAPDESISHGKRRLKWKEAGLIIEFDSPPIEKALASLEGEFGGEASGRVGNQRSALRRTERGPSALRGARSGSGAHGALPERSAGRAPPPES